MKGKMILIGAVMLALALLLTLAPCCGKGEGPGVTPTPGTPGVTPTPTPQAKTLKIGFLGPLSGPVSYWGTTHELGAKWAADDINAAGGIKVGNDTYVVRVISCDDKATGSVAAECASKLVYDEGIHYVIGPITTTEAVLPIFNENKCFFVEIGAKFNGGPDKPYYVNGSVYYPLWIAAYYAAAKEAHPEIQKLAIINPDTAGGHDTTGWSADKAEDLGVTVVAKNYYTGGTTDFYPMLTKLLLTNPDTIDTGGGGPGDQALIVKQARELGFTGRFLQPNWVPTELLIQTVGLAGMYKISTSLPDFSTQYYSDAMRELNRRYMAEKAKPGETSMPDCVVHGYSQMMFYKKAIETAGSLDPDEVVKVLDDPNFTFERYYVSNAKLGGIETFGIRRQMPHFNPYGEIVVEGGQAKVVQMGGKAVNVP